MTVAFFPSRTADRMVLRWHGGKVLLAPWILSHFPAHDRYTETFGGGAALLLAKSPARAEIYNDLDAQVHALFSVLRSPEDAETLAQMVHWTPFSRRVFDVSYEPSDSQIETARRLLVRSYLGFSPAAATRPVTRRSGMGINSSPGKFEPSAWTTVPDRIRAAAERMRGVLVENRPAIQVLREHDSSTTLHYVDPPYLHASRGSSRDYRHEMTDDDHADLLDTLLDLEGFVVVSGYPSALYDARLQDWKRIQTGSHTHAGKRRIEVLWINPAAEKASAKSVDLFSRQVA